MFLTAVIICKWVVLTTIVDNYYVYLRQNGEIVCMMRNLLIFSKR